MIATSLIPYFEDEITAKVIKINQMIANEGPYDFEFPIYGNKLNLNLTMTTAPRTKVNYDLIELFFDGQFVLPEAEGAQRTRILGANGDITDYPPRLEHSNSEQFWIHEDTFDSLFKVASEEIFPIDYSSDYLQEHLETFFPEL